MKPVQGQSLSPQQVIEILLGGTTLSQAEEDRLYVLMERSYQKALAHYERLFADHDADQIQEPLPAPAADALRSHAMLAADGFWGWVKEPYKTLAAWLATGAEKEFAKQVFTPSEVARWRKALGLDLGIGATERYSGEGLLSVTATAGWKLRTPQRYGGYRKELFDALEDFHERGCPIPTARQVLDYMRAHPSAEIDVQDNFIRYGDGKEANLKAIQQAIRGLTSDN